MEETVKDVQVSQRTIQSNKDFKWVILEKDLSDLSETHIYLSLYPSIYDMATLIDGNQP